MNLSRQWLNDYTSIAATDKEFCDAMTMSGSKVESFANTGDGIENVVAGRVTFMSPHPDSDHMWVCKVDAGQSRELTIVTGAQNVSVDDMVPVALDGSVLPGGKEIHTGVLRGVTSEGMLCSLGELGLDTHDYPYAIEDGIFIMQEPCEPGQDIRQVLGLNDTVVEFEITNNRPDCLSVIGLAREAAATFDTPLTLHEPEVQGAGDGDDIRNYLNVEIQEPQLCPRYTARMVKNIRIEPSPAWLRRRLRAAGIRPINNIVDITNYVMQEYGQPMHAFDYSCVGGGKIIVRKARSGENLMTLDGNNRNLTTNMLVIADTEKPIGLAGVMGGGNSEIVDETTTIVFESANFNGTSIRKTALALGMRTDASSKFEKGLDPEGTIPAVQRACELVEMLGAGDVIDGMIDVVGQPTVAKTVLLDPERINRLLGTDFTRAYMISVLEKLGFTMDGDQVVVPSWRSDIETYADLAEEVARFYGYDIIEPTMFRGETAQGGWSAKQAFENRVGTLCRAMGFNEILTYSFGSKTAWDKIRLPEDSPLRQALIIQNPLGEDRSVMRTTPMPSMLDVLSTNAARRNPVVRFYELATVYRPLADSPLADESVWLTLGEYGGKADFFQLKGCVEAILKDMRVENVRYAAEHNDPAFHPGRCAQIVANGQVIGILGQIHPTVCDNYGLESDIFYAQLNVPAMRALQAPESTYTPLPRFPAVTRDIALVCAANIPVADLEDTITAAGGQYLESVELFDVYTGAPIPVGCKSVAFSLTLRAADQTLTEEHATQTRDAILAALAEKHGAVIR
jgi:phenylalanyl-tRNA synthetase beta chain